MNEAKHNEIKRHNFELAKNRLKSFSENTAEEINFMDVQESTLFVFDHRVTGKEFKDQLEVIQKNFMSTNEISNKIIKEFRAIYDALDTLDRDYILSIVANVKAIEKTSDDIRKQQTVLREHNEKLLNQQSLLDDHQIEIKKTVDNISKIVEVLKNFKEKLDIYKHLVDIDIIWNDVSKYKEYFPTIDNRFQNVESDILNLQEYVNAINDFVASIKKHEHLQDIDEVWDSLCICKTDIKKIDADIHRYYQELEKMIQSGEKLYDSIRSNTDDINILKEYKNKLTVIDHLEDIDNIWMNVEKHTNELLEHKKQDSELAGMILKNKTEIEENIEGVAKRNNEDIESLNRKLNYALGLVGISMGLAIVELFLLFK